MSANRRNLGDDVCLIAEDAHIGDAVDALQIHHGPISRHITGLVAERGGYVIARGLHIRRLAAAIAWVGEQPERDAGQRDRLLRVVVDGLRPAKPQRDRPRQPGIAAGR